MLWHGKSGIAIDATLFILIIGRGRSSAMTPEESVFFFFFMTIQKEKCVTCKHFNNHITGTTFYYFLKDTYLG